jgi:hypothetical protein
MPQTAFFAHPQICFASLCHLMRWSDHLLKVSKGSILDSFLLSNPHPIHQMVLLRSPLKQFQNWYHPLPLHYFHPGPNHLISCLDYSSSLLEGLCISALSPSLFPLSKCKQLCTPSFLKPSLDVHPVCSKLCTPLLGRQCGTPHCCTPTGFSHNCLCVCSPNLLLSWRLALAPPNPLPPPCSECLPQDNEFHLIVCLQLRHPSFLWIQSNLYLQSYTSPSLPHSLMYEEIHEFSCISVYMCTNTQQWELIITVPLCQELTQGFELISFLIRCAMNLYFTCFGSRNILFPDAQWALLSQLQDPPGPLSIPSCFLLCFAL